MDSPTASAHDMGVDHRRAHVRVAQQLMDGPTIIPVLQQVGRKGVTKRMTACRLLSPVSVGRIGSDGGPMVYIPLVSRCLPHRTIPIKPDSGQ